ncbi:MAG: phenylalanine--tRNA ligase subunit alpha [Candidatus Lokiarchaeota archaeon]
MTIQLKQNVIEILKILKRKKKKVIASNFASELNLDYIVLMSAINDLKDYKLADFKEEEVHNVFLNKEGREYLEKGLPERQILNVMIKDDIKETTLEELEEKSNLPKKLFYIGISNMKRNRWIAQSKATGENKIFLIAEEYPKKPIENFLLKFQEQEKFDYSDLSKEEKELIKVCNKRKLIEANKKTQRILYLTEKGKKVKLSNIKVRKEISKITPEMLSNGSWKNFNFKSFDVSKPGPLLKAGKIHPIIRLINKIRHIFLSMGFTEIRGPIVESAFFNFDALFQPQDHPAREMQDTFYLNNPKETRLPEPDRVKAVKETHENGGDSGSTGWGYEWKEDIAKQTVLRTHTTATTIRRLAEFYQKNETGPIKVFCIDRVFRNESVDKSHLAEFMQVEGIVIGDNLNLGNLIGLLSKFYEKMGFSKIVTRPGFFPYTEPSMEVSVYYDKIDEWLEMGGSGIFRPEVTYPWGIKEPTRVLAWGQGLGRIAMLYFGRKDIRDFYINPINWLRKQSYY